jgi:hypothetical protein
MIYHCAMRDNTKRPSIDPSSILQRLLDSLLGDDDRLLVGPEQGNERDFSEEAEVGDVDSLP